MNLYDYSRWPNFPKHELICKHTGLENPNVNEFIELMDRVQWMRTKLHTPFNVRSAYRHPTHPEEVKKVTPGQHTIAAIDINLNDTSKYFDFLELALVMGFTGVGINCKGAYKNHFIHLDMRPFKDRFIWSYP